jgi:hypothetical protein
MWQNCLPCSSFNDLSVPLIFLNNYRREAKTLLFAFRRVAVGLPLAGTPPSGKNLGKEQGEGTEGNPPRMTSAFALRH